MSSNRSDGAGTLVATNKAQGGKRTGGIGCLVTMSRRWKLEDAKARFSEVVRLARSEGPQRVSVRGKDAVVVMSVEDLARLLPASPPQVPLVRFLEELRLDGLERGRERD